MKRNSGTWSTRGNAVAFLMTSVTLIACIGCTSTDFVTFSNKKTIDPKTDGRYSVIGYLHGRFWHPQLFYVLPLGPSLDDKSARAIDSPLMGEIGPVSLHSENYTINPAAVWAHYGGFIPYVLGTKCDYVSATYVVPLPVQTVTNTTK